MEWPLLASAQHVLTLGREAFFLPEQPDLPCRSSLALENDDQVPQFGFVGDAYVSGRVLVLGINPGNGPSNTHRTPGDARMMPALRHFATEPTPQNFRAASLAYKAECQHWPVWQRHCSAIMGPGRLSIEQIAYANCLPWRTASQSRFAEHAASKAAALWVQPMIRELMPKVIVALGKRRVPQILEMTGEALPKVIVWNRSQAATAQALRERAEAAMQLFTIVRSESAGRP